MRNDRASLSDVCRLLERLAAQSHVAWMEDEVLGRNKERGSSPASRGGAGPYIEGELGAFYLLSMLANIPAHGLPNAQIAKVRFQGTDLGYKLDDLIIHGVGPSGDALLEIQSKRDIKFTPGDAVYKDVAAQIAKSQSTEIAADRHFLAIATQRTSRKISGAYQDVLRWAAADEKAEDFYTRLKAEGVGNADMRTFVDTTRANLVAAGVVDDPEIIWRLLRRMLILEFDFESSAPLARSYGLMLARQVLADEDVARADALWRALVEMAIATGTTGGALDRDALKHEIINAGFKLAGDRDFRPARAKLAELVRMTLDCIGNKVAGVTLPRLKSVAALDDALEAGSFVEIRAAPGVGKSWVLRHGAERIARQSPILVLDPDRTPAGGWIELATRLGVPGTAAAFLTDLAASGGGVIFIDGLDMIDDKGRQRTIEDLLRAAAKIPGFKVVATARAPLGTDVEPWLSDEIVDSFGGKLLVEIGNLDDEEVAYLVEHAPALRALLDPKHPAAAIARNLYRLSRLLKVPSATEIRTEGQLADRWWKSADGAPQSEVRAARRLLESLADQALRGTGAIMVQKDSPARAHLVDALTLKEVRPDQLDFYHDVLRDWAVGNYIAADPVRLGDYDLTKPLSARIARGIEFAGRITLELGTDFSAWTTLLAHLSPQRAHGSWRRQAMLALTRSEARGELLEKCGPGLLSDEAALFNELCTAITAVETVATVDVLKMPEGAAPDLPRSFRTNTTGSAFYVLRWVIHHQDEIPIEAIRAVAGLTEIQFLLLKSVMSVAKPTTEMLFGWLRQLDVRDTPVTIPGGRGNSHAANGMRRQTIEKLRMMSLLLAAAAPAQLKSYLKEIAAEKADDKIKDIRLLSQAIAPVAPIELADLILESLVQKRLRRREDDSMEEALGHGDSYYMPASPAQPPFFDLLEASPSEGLRLIRTLVASAVAFYAGDCPPGNNGYTLVLETGPRFFPWTDSVFWSRDQSREYSVVSGLKALEAWGHKRLDDGEPVDVVLADILGPEGSCAAYLMVAIDVLLSHFDKARNALVPFIANPEILAIDQYRRNDDILDSGIERLSLSDEPKGKIRLADLGERLSRKVGLLDAIPNYLGNDPVAAKLRVQLGSEVAKLDPIEAHSGWTDPRLIARFVHHALQPEHWLQAEDGKLYLQPSTELLAHQELMDRQQAKTVGTIDTESRITSAIEGGEQATPETARLAIDYADGDLPDDSDTDALKSRSTRLIATALIAARDGDDVLLDEHEGWIRQVIAIGLAERADRYSSSVLLRFHRPAMAALALIHLWLRQGKKADRDVLLALATRQDRAAVLAFDKAALRILEIEPRLMKAAMRAAYASVIWRWHTYDENEAPKLTFEEERDAMSAAAVTAEIAWLDGGAEPEWPAWPEESPHITRGSRMRLPGSIAKEHFDAGLGDDIASSRPKSMLHVDSNAAAKWLTIIRAAPKGSVDWGPQVMDAYSGWTDRINGLGLAADVEIDRKQSNWNNEFYILFAKHLLDAGQARFDADIRQITDLPDKSFSAIAAVVLRAADALYFNDAERPAVRPVALRSLLGTRVMVLSRWEYVLDPGGASIDMESAEIIARMLLNDYNFDGRTDSYLPPLLFDRVDPLFDAIKPLMPGGPTSFVALCTMNMLLVAPRARHIDFLLDAVEAWFGRTIAASMWLDMGIGRQIIRWFDAVIAEDPSLLAPAHPARVRIDGVLGRLVGVGIAEAHEIERRVEVAAGNPQRA